MAIDYITTTQAAKKWGVSVRWVQKYCKEGRIPGTTEIGVQYLIPKNAKKPGDKRNENN